MKTYKVYFSQQAERQYKKLDKYTQALIRTWIDKNLSDCENPRQFGKALKGNLKGLWRYRVADYRIIAKIDDDTIIIFILEIGHRRDIYE